MDNTENKLQQATDNIHSNTAVTASPDNINLDIERTPIVHPATEIVADLQARETEVARDLDSTTGKLNAELSDLEAFDLEYHSRRIVMVANIESTEARIQELNETRQHIFNAASAMNGLINKPHVNTAPLAGRKVTPRKAATKKPSSRKGAS